MLMWEKRLAKLLHPEKKEAYVYIIEYDSVPIYVGSTLNISGRQTQHNNSLLKKGAYHKSWDYPLYSFLREKGVTKIELKVIKTFEDIKEGFNYKREIIEEKAIIHCLNKGIKLFNSIYPCKYNDDGTYLIRKI
jgi:predicted GIY-YIG superfamily endonuclease